MPGSSRTNSRMEFVAQSSEFASVLNANACFRQPSRSAERYGTVSPCNNQRRLKCSRTIQVQRKTTADRTKKIQVATRTRPLRLRNRNVAITLAIQQKGLITVRRSGAAKTLAEIKDGAECGASFVTAIKVAQYAAIAQQGKHNNRVDRGMKGVSTLLPRTGPLSITARLYKQTLSGV